MTVVQSQYLPLPTIHKLPALGPPWKTKSTGCRPASDAKVQLALGELVVSWTQQVHHQLGSFEIAPYDSIIVGD